MFATLKAWIITLDIFFEFGNLVWNPIPFVLFIHLYCHKLSKIKSHFCIDTVPLCPNSFISTDLIKFRTKCYRIPRTSFIFGSFSMFRFSELLLTKAYVMDVTIPSICPLAACSTYALGCTCHSLC